MSQRNRLDSQQKCWLPAPWRGVKRYENIPKIEKIIAARIAMMGKATSIRALLTLVR